MEDLKGHNDKKRSREDSDRAISAAEPKLTPTDLDLDSDSTNSDTSSSISFINSDPEQNSTESSKRFRFESTQSESTNLQSDLLEILDDPEAEKDQAIMGLDSVIKSFEEEILFPAAGNVPAPVPAPELGYLLEASDDELGLPPAPETVAGEGKIEAAEFAAPENSGDMFELGLGLGLGFEEGLPSFGDSFGFGIGGGDNEYVALEGLFDCEGDLLWRTEESLGAV